MIETEKIQKICVTYLKFSSIYLIFKDMLSVPAYKLYVTLMLVLHAVIEKHILNSHNVSTVLKKKSSIHIYQFIYCMV